MGNFGPHNLHENLPTPTVATDNGFLGSGHHVFAIAQGSTFDDLRREAAESLAALDFPGYAVGGVSVGEPEPEMMKAVELAEPFLPANKARYAMGLGTPAQLVELVARGVDMFDCVLPTRVARNGTAFTRKGTYAIKGGAVPREYIPAVEKGLEETLPAGVLAGFPVVDVKVTLFDGSFHEVDSNENAFKMAASMAFKDGMRRASPTLLEPMMAVEVETPEDFMGNVMGDLSSRRGMVQGMDDVAGTKVIKAEVPLAEMFGYSTTLRSLSQGRATYTMEFKHYAEAPKNVAEAIINKKD